MGQGRNRESRAAKLQDAGISPKQWPKKKSGRKRAGLPDSTNYRPRERCEERTTVGRGRSRLCRGATGSLRL
jgi:hypothetical protein